MLSTYSVYFRFSKLYQRKSIDSFCSVFSNTISLRMKHKNHYETLNLQRNCSSKEIKDAFISLSKQYHPDKNKDNPKAKDQFVQVNEAYNVLIKPDSRREYDFNLQHVSEPYHTQKGFYKVNRDDYHYREPWKDPMYSRAKDFSQDDGSYYGVKGIKKQSNEQIVRWIMIFVGVGLFIQIFIIRLSHESGRERMDRISAESRRHLQEVRERAELYGSKERQLEEFKRRMNKDE